MGEHFKQRAVNLKVLMKQDLSSALIHSFYDMFSNLKDLGRKERNHPIIFYDIVKIIYFPN